MKQIECFSCTALQEPTPPLRRDEDRLDIFKCSSCGTEFKVDMEHYFLSRDNPDLNIKTHSINYDPNKDYVKELENSQKQILEERGLIKKDSKFTVWLKKEWIYIVLGLLIFYFFLI